jgi:DHA2 family multidrug resistance protein
MLPKQLIVIFFAGDDAARQLPFLRSHRQDVIMTRQTNTFMITFTTMLATMMQAVDTSVANVALPHMQGSFSAGVDEITWVITSYLVANAVIVPMTGWLGNFYGRRRIFILSMGVFTLASVGTGSAPTLFICIAMRVLQGISGGIIVPMSQAVLLEAFPAEKRGKALSYFGVGVVFGPIIGPILGGWITDHFGWRWIFYINLPIGVLAIFLALIFVFDPPYIKRPEGVVDYPSFLYIIFGLGSLEIVLSRGQRFDWFQSHFIQTFAVLAVAGLALFIWRSITHKHALVDLSVLKNKEFGAGVFLCFFQYFVLYATLVMLPLFVQNMLGYTATSAGLILAPGGAAALMAMLVGGRLIERVDARWLLLFGVLTMLASLKMLSDMDLDVTFSYIASARGLQGFGTGLLFISVAAAAYGTLSANEMGHATGFYNLIRNEASSVGVATASTLLARRTQFHLTRLTPAVNPYNPNFRALLAHLSQVPSVRSEPSATGEHLLIMALISRQVEQQARTMSYIDIFRFMGMVLIGFLLLIPILRGKVRKQPAPVAGRAHG